MKRNIHNIESFAALFENKYLRTFLPLGDCLLEYINFENPEVLQTMQYLRVLSLSEYSITKLPHSLGNLKHLRYLDLSSTDVKEIPYSVCTLYNLQTLLLESCRNLTELPDSIGNLKHLRYLDLSWTHIKEIPDAICSLYNLHTLLLSFCAYITWLPANVVNLINLRHLVIEGTSLKEMPMQMSKLKDLRTLSDFIVGKESGCNIKELKDLQDLRGSLCISRLQNVVNVEDVSKASLKDKKYLNQLSLKWEHDNDDAPKQMEVLEKLQPHTNLEKLYIEDYGGMSFPNWVGHHSFSRIVEVELGDCKNCYWLPTLGQLPSLTSLRIAGLDMVERIGDEFYCNGSSSHAKPFKSLEILSFSNMSQWKEWSQFEGDEEDGVFSHLKELSFGYCPKLNGACLPDYLPSVTNLYISGCHQLLASLASVRYSSLGFLRIYDCPELESIPKWGLPSNIHKISIHRCEKMESLSKAGWPPNLKSLEIFQCEKLFANCMQWNLETLTSLTSLKISEIDAVLNSFPEEGQLPANLTFLELNSLRNLKSLNGKALQQLISLKELRIYWCHQLQCMPEEGLPISLSQLDVNQCGFLNPRCQRDVGEDWPKIAHISRIQIDDEAI
nr:putative disease resistance RPP13-like protein 1 isoform X1 [Ziziphus jujuba var. spinosa]